MVCSPPAWFGKKLSILQLANSHFLTSCDVITNLYAESLSFPYLLLAHMLVSYYELIFINYLIDHEDFLMLELLFSL
jgi:hypothetical protein